MNADAYSAVLLKCPASPAEFVWMARYHHGVTLSDIAKAVKASVSFVSDVEHGRRFLSLQNALRWARGMGLPDECFVRMVVQEDLDRRGIDMQVTLTVRVSDAASANAPETRPRPREADDV